MRAPGQYSAGMANKRKEHARMVRHVRYFKQALRNALVLLPLDHVAALFAQGVVDHAPAPARDMEGFTAGFRTAENLRPKLCKTCGKELHAVDGSGNLACANGHVTITDELAGALFGPKRKSKARAAKAKAAGAGK